MKGHSLLLSWIATTLGLLAGDKLLAGVAIGSVGAALIAAAVLGLVNATIKPVLFILTLPVTLLTLGLFTFVLNAMMLGLVAWLVPGFTVASLMSGIGLAIVVAIVHALIVGLFDNRRHRIQRFHD
jgi:putative membrane protein